MTKKIFTFLIILSCTCALYVHASNVPSQEIVSIYIFNHFYYGTLEAKDSTTIFSTLPDSPEAFQVEGTWKGNRFVGDCTIIFDDGRQAAVKYKNGFISGTVVVSHPDGTSRSFSCSNGKPYRTIRSFSADGRLTDLDWFYMCTPQSQWSEDALTLSYTDLTNHPNDYIDLPVRITGTIQDIYETLQYSYAKVSDDKGNLYLFKYKNSKIEKNTAPKTKNYSIGETITFCGIYVGFSDLLLDSVNLYEHTAGYEVSFKEIGDHLITSDTFDALKDISCLKDPDLSGRIPTFQVVSAESNGDTVDPLQLSSGYREICEYPFYYIEQETKKTGTVIYEDINLDKKQTTLLLRENKTSDIYAVRFQNPKGTHFLGKKIVCSGTLNGNSKIPYLNPQTGKLGFALYPNIAASSVKSTKTNTK